MPIVLIDKVQPFAIAIALGLLIGIERERSHPPGYQPMGARTFVLVGLLGAIAANLQEIYISVAITFFVGAAVVAGYIRSSSSAAKEGGSDVGITTEIAAILTYVLGYLAKLDPFLSLILGVIVLVTLLARSKIHKFSRRQITTEEITAATILLVIGIGIIPFLPDQSVGPWKLFNPRTFGILVLIIAVIQFSAYISIRLFGNTLGLIFSGFLAGFVSSTAATMALLHNKKPDQNALIIAAGILFATIGMFVETLTICYVISVPLAQSMAVMLFPSVAVICVLAVLFRSYIWDHEQPYPFLSNPLSLVSAFLLAVILLGMIALVSVVQIYFGNQGLYVVSVLSGFLQTRGAVLASANLYFQNKIALANSYNAIGLVVLASFISKYAIVWFMGQRKVAWYTTGFLTLMLMIFLVSWGFLLYI